MKQATILKITSASALAGPLIYVMVLVILGELYPGYSHISQTMSVLGALDAPHRMIMNTLGFPVLGLSVITFAHALHHGIGRIAMAIERPHDAHSRLTIISSIDRAGPCLMAISGIALGLTGVFAGEPPDIGITWKGAVHSALSLLAALSFAVSLALIGVRQWSAEGQKKQAAISEFVAIITLTMWITSGLDIVEAQKGLYQRIAMGVPMTWMMATSYRLTRISRPRT